METNISGRYWEPQPETEEIKQAEAVARERREKAGLTGEDPELPFI